MPLDESRSGQRYDRRQDEKKQTKSGLPGEDEAPLPPPVEPIKTNKAVGRNDPCPCGSGKKYKKCCGR